MGGYKQQISGGKKRGVPATKSGGKTTGKTEQSPGHDQNAARADHGAGKKRTLLSGATPVALQEMPKERKCRNIKISEHTKKKTSVSPKGGPGQKPEKGKAGKNLMGVCRCMPACGVMEFDKKMPEPG